VLVVGIIGNDVGHAPRYRCRGRRTLGSGSKELALKDKEEAFKGAQASARDAREQLLLTLRTRRGQSDEWPPWQRFEALKAIRRRRDSGDAELAHRSHCRAGPARTWKSPTSGRLPEGRHCLAFDASSSVLPGSIAAAA